jgi:hypothetical protein
VTATDLEYPSLEELGAVVAGGGLLERVQHELVVGVAAPRRLQVLTAGRRNIYLRSSIKYVRVKLEPSQTQS